MRKQLISAQVMNFS